MPALGKSEQNRLDNKVRMAIVTFKLRIHTPVDMTLMSTLFECKDFVFIATYNRLCRGRIDALELAFRL